MLIITVIPYFIINVLVIINQTSHLQRRIIYMYINAINSSYGLNNKYSKPQTFSGLITDKSALPVINNMPKNDILELKKIKKRLSRTKFWDMKISRIGNIKENLKFEFINKKNCHGVITDGIYPYDKKDNTIRVYSIIYGPENVSGNLVETLRYKSSNRAEKVYNKYLQNLELVRLRGCNLTPLESIKGKVIELNMLEEASYFAEKSDKLKYVNTELTTKNNVGNEIKHI